MGDKIFLVFSVISSIFSLFAWKKYSDNDYKHLLSVSIFVILLLLSKMFLINFLPDVLKQVVSIAVYLSWILVIVFVVKILRKKS